MITPIEIRQHSFRKKTLGGYDIEEVQQFLASLSLDWEKMIEENRRLRTELDKVQAGYNSLKEVEGMLQKTLHQAEQSTKDTLENARKRAGLIVNEAEAKSREIVREGVAQRQSIDREINDLCDRRDEILTQLNVFLKSQTDRLAGFGKRTPVVIQNQYDDKDEKRKDMDNPFAASINMGGLEDEKSTVDDIVEQL